MKIGRAIYRLILFSFVATTVISVRIYGQSDIISHVDRNIDGTRYAITYVDRLTILDESQNLISTFSFPSDQSYTVPTASISHDGTMIYIGNRSEKVIYTTDTFDEIVRLDEFDFGPSSVQWSQDNTHIAAKAFASLQIYRVSDGMLLQSFDDGHWTLGFFNRRGSPLWSPNDAYFAGIIDRDKVVVFSATDGSVVAEYTVNDLQILDLAWNPNSNLLALTGFRRVSPSTPNSFPDEGNPDGNVNLLHSVVTVNALSGAVTSSYSGLRDSMSTLVWSPDGMELLGSDGGRRLYVWDSGSGLLLDSFLLAPESFTLLEYSQTGSSILIAYDSRFETTLRPDDVFVPMSTYSYSLPNSTFEYVVPNPSPEKLADLLALCVSNANLVAEGVGLLEDERHSAFEQWVEQLDETNFLSCKQDLQLNIRAIANERPVPTPSSDF